MDLAIRPADRPVGSGITGPRPKPTAESQSDAQIARANERARSIRTFVRPLAHFVLILPVANVKKIGGNQIRDGDWCRRTSSERRLDQTRRANETFFFLSAAAAVSPSAVVAFRVYVRTNELRRCPLPGLLKAVLNLVTSDHGSSAGFFAIKRSKYQNADWGPLWRSGTCITRRCVSTSQSAPVFLPVAGWLVLPNRMKRGRSLTHSLGQFKKAGNSNVELFFTGRQAA